MADLLDAMRHCAQQLLAHREQCALGLAGVLGLVVDDVDAERVLALLDLRPLLLVVLAPLLAQTAMHRLYVATAQFALLASRQHSRLRLAEDSATRRPSFRMDRS
eukprot:8067961-Alexandrium_andersonii.AAC.1